MAKKRSLPAQSNTLLSFFSKGTASSSKSGSTPAKKKVKTGSSANDPVCLLDSSDEEQSSVSNKVDLKGKGKAKQVIIDLPDSSQDQPVEDEEEGKVKAELNDDIDFAALPEANDIAKEGIFGADEFDALISSVGDQLDTSRTSCQKWEDEHTPAAFATHDFNPPPPQPLPRRSPSLSLDTSSFITGPSEPTRGRSLSSSRTADPRPNVIDLDADDEDDPPLEDGFVFGDHDEDGGWNAADDEQADQDDPGEEDMENGLGEREEDEYFDEGFRGYADEVIIASNDEEEEPLASPSKAFRSISSFQHVLPSPAPESPREPPPQKRDAFSIMMSKDRQVEETQWKEAEEDFTVKKPWGERRKAPFFKVLTGMPIAVDAFRYGAVPLVTTYLLSHAHSDHYTNLSKAWKQGPIYCSQTTANLVLQNLKVEPKWVKVLPYDKPTLLPDTGGVICTMISANHCPGSSIFLFEGKRTVHAGDSPYPPKGLGGKKIWRYLHCGDFRACPSMVMHPAIKKAPLDEVYLDTTYLNPQYCFPPQPIVIASVATLTHDIVRGGHLPHQPAVHRAGNGVAGWLRKDETEAEKEEREMKERIKGDRTLIVVGTYSVGKERLAKGIAQRLGTKIYAEARKRTYIDAQTDDLDLTALMTLKSSESQVHLIPLGEICLEGLTTYLERYNSRYDRILGYRPTGWTYTVKKGTNINPEVKALLARDQAATFDARELMPTRGSSEKIVMFGVPYSEHSSFFELTCFALSVPGEPKMIPTVNVASKRSRDKMEVWFKKWAAEKKKRQAAKKPSVVEYRDVTYW